MPCNAYYFDSGICGLAFILNANLTCDVHDEHNKNVYLNGNFLIYLINLIQFIIIAVIFSKSSPGPETLKKLGGLELGLAFDTKNCSVFGPDFLFLHFYQSFTK